MKRIFIFLIITGIARRCLKRIYCVTIINEIHIDLQIYEIYFICVCEYIQCVSNRGQKLHDTEVVSVFDFAVALKSAMKCLWMPSFFITCS